MQNGTLLTTEAGRQRLVNAFLSFTQGTLLAAQARERTLLAQFVTGELTIEQVVKQLEVQATEQG